MPKAATRKADEPVVTGAMHGDRAIHRTVPAGQSRANADTLPANSVFAFGGARALYAEPKGRGGKRFYLPQLDVSVLTVSTDLRPMRPQGGRLKGQTRYDDLFELLKKDGQSVAIPIRYKNAVQKAAQTYCKSRQAQLGQSRLRVLTVDGQTAGVFRMAAKDAP